MRPPRSPLRSTLVALALVAAAAAAACHSDSAGPPDDSFAACPDVGFAQTSALPLDEVVVGRLPASFDEPYAARILDSDGSVAGFALVSVDEAGDARLTVPIHPGSPLEGGPLQLALTDGAEQCAPVTFTVQPLPAADGEVAAVADLLADILRHQAGLLGTTPEEILATEPAALAPLHWPLATALNAISNPDNEYSLVSVVQGTSPWSDPVGLPLTERLLARTGLRESLESSMSAPQRAVGPIRVGDPRSECTPAAIGTDAQQLDACMELASDVKFGIEGVSGEVLGDLSLAFATLGLIPIPAVEISTAIAGLIAFHVEAERTMMAGFLPSSLTSMQVDFRQTEFLEDDVGPGSWAQARVTATSEGWDVGALALKGMLAQAGVLRPLEKYVSTHILDDFTTYLISTWLIPSLIGDETLETFRTEPMTFGPVDVTSDEWSESSVALGNAVAFVGHQIYDLKRAGTATISVRTEDGAFGGQQIAESAQITIGQLDVDIAPDEVIVEPGELVAFTVTVSESAHPYAVDLVQGLSLQGEAEIVYDGGGASTHKLWYTAPQSPNAAEPDVISVYHTTTEGARGGGAPPRTASTTVRFGGVRITTPPRCVDPGAAPFQIEVEVAGGIPDPELAWTTTGGDISDTGVFTPPTQAQLVTITVALADKPTIKSSLQLQVGGCSCLATISVGPEAGATVDLSFRLSNDLSAVESISWRGENLSTVGFWFGPEFGPNATTIPLNTTGGFQGVTMGLLNGLSFMNPDDLDEPTIQPLNVVLTENTGSVLAGSITGTVIIAADPEPQQAALLFNFRIQADPIFSDDQVKFCEVPSGPA